MTKATHKKKTHLIGGLLTVSKVESFIIIVESRVAGRQALEQ